jgi:hypothetical protein
VPVVLLFLAVLLVLAALSNRAVPVVLSFLAALPA